MVTCFEDASTTYVGGLVEADAAVEGRDGGNLLLSEIEVDALEVLGHDLGPGALGDDGKAALGGPAEQDLRGGAVVVGRNLLDGLILEERSKRISVLHVELLEAGRAERAVGSDGDALVLGEVDQLLLDEVGVVLDLEGGRADLGGAEEVVDQLGLEVGDTDALSKALADEGLQGRPGLQDGGLAGADLVLAIVVPAGGVADGGVNPLKGDGEVDEVEVEVVNAPVGELLLDDGLDALGVVEGVPELGHDEELLTLHDAFRDGAGDTLAALNLVAVVYLSLGQPLSLSSVCVFVLSASAPWHSPTTDPPPVPLALPARVRQNSTPPSAGGVEKKGGGGVVSPCPSLPLHVATLNSACSSIMVKPAQPLPAGWWYGGTEGEERASATYRKHRRKDGSRP